MPQTRGTTETDSSAPRREVVEVEVERLGGPDPLGPDPLGPEPTRLEALGNRIWRATAPVLMAMFLDLGDLLTAGPLGAIGLPLGLVLGYLVGGFIDVPPTWRIALMVLTGVYFMAPFTSMVPLATVLAFVLKVAAPKQLRREPFA